MTGENMGALYRNRALSPYASRWDSYMSLNLKRDILTLLPPIIHAMGGTASLCQ